ncbi:hypothetical protein C0993_003332, partial [Termitomyces sp. T159_Od127]
HALQAQPNAMEVDWEEVGEGAAASISQAGGYVGGDQEGAEVGDEGEGEEPDDLDQDEADEGEEGEGAEDDEGDEETVDLMQVEEEELKKDAPGLDDVATNGVGVHEEEPRESHVSS